MKTYFILPLLLFLFFYAPLSSAQDRGREVFEEFDQRRQALPYEMATIEMNIVDRRGRTRTRILQSWQFDSGNISKSLLLFEAPADVRGTGLLSISDQNSEQQWLYLPAVGRVQSISGSRRTDRFVGSDFTFEDLGVQNPDNFEFSLAEEQENDYLIEAIPVNESQYTRILFYINKNTFSLTKAEYFSDSEIMVKKLTTDDLEEVADGIWRPAKMTMRDLQENRETVLQWTNRSFPETIDDAIFTERRLRRGL